ncbi:MAG: Asp-tRNA(Asn)/Glu-tRNA(Gln) amidotransferase subunit GatB [Elusimicrobia bacterium]|nr:Asp-tRNA(Asn)/Glu-tRNA(Gln) amidotransferase subunit GatB [Elusimicrobiota bacterium]
MDPKFEMVIGLEVHCQLKTRTKLFCACPADGFGGRANASICPVCTGQPGTLPVLNRRAVELAFRAALAFGCRLREASVFARKNYFYPDLPKGYQISQYEEPFSEAGVLEIMGPPAKRVGIHRIHMEEDAGKLLHELGSERLEYSLVDFNRAGVPLIEIVSEPDLRGSEEAYQYLTNLKSILQYVGVSNCDMEKGEMRCDANISVRLPGASALGTKVEIKNLNSFRSVKDALEYEFHRQCEALKTGERIYQETRLWDAERGVTETMRSKEEAHDYRYFSEPDLVPLLAEPSWVARIRSELPELPAARKARFVSAYKLPEYDAGVLTSQKALADYYEDCLAACGASGAKTAANWVMTELMGKLNAEGKDILQSAIAARSLGELMSLIEKGTLTSRLAKDVFAQMWETGRSAGQIVESTGLAVVSDLKQLGEWVSAAMSENPRAVADLQGGKERAIGAIVGSVMKKSRGKADPAAVQKLILEKIR